MRYLTNYCTLALLLTLPSIAFSYLDPGTGSMILQGVIGAIAIAMATGRIWWYKFKSLFSSKNKSLDDEQNKKDDSKDTD